MEILNSANVLIEQVVGKANYKEGIKYRPASYLIIEKLEDDNALVYNNLTKELLLLSNIEFNALKLSNFDKTDELKKTFVEKHFLVEENCDENAVADTIRFLAKVIPQDNEITLYTIITTTACNARCFYCFEAGSKIDTMDEQTAKDTADFIIKHSNGKTVYIRWFGGEPLCNTTAIGIISNKLSEANINFKSEIITNGYLINKDIANKCRQEWNIKRAQITLDGLNETYNKVKNYVNGDLNAFEKVINNIKLLIEHEISVSIRLNMDLHNSKELTELVDYITNHFKEYIGTKLLDIYSRPIYENTGYIKTVHKENEREVLYFEHVALQNYIYHVGFRPRTALNKKITINNCAVDTKNAILISPTGNLGKCEHNVDSNFFASIYNYDKNIVLQEYYPPVEKCKGCPAYPSCLRPKICSNCCDDCYDYEQYIRIEGIKKGMRNIYHNHLEKSE